MDDDTLYAMFCQRRQMALQIALQRAAPADSQDQILQVAETYLAFIEGDSPASGEDRPENTLQ